MTGRKQSLVDFPGRPFLARGFRRDRDNFATLDGIICGVKMMGFSVPSSPASPHGGNHNRQTGPTGGGNYHLAEDWAEVEARQGRD